MLNRVPSIDALLSKCELQARRTCFGFSVCQNNTRCSQTSSNEHMPIDFTWFDTVSFQSVEGLLSPLDTLLI